MLCNSNLSINLADCLSNDFAVTFGETTLQISWFQIVRIQVVILSHSLRGKDKAVLKTGFNIKES